MHNILTCAAEGWATLTGFPAGAGFPVDEEEEGVVAGDIGVPQSGDSVRWLLGAKIFVIGFRLA